MLLSKEVEVKVNYKHANYYRKKGYEIPMKIGSHNKLVTDISKTIKVKFEDMSHGSDITVDWKCDAEGCDKIIHPTVQEYYKRNRDGKMYCHSCAIKLFIGGENHYKWNPNKTDEERQNGRNYPEYTDFIKKVLKRDRYTCRCCGKHADSVHHLYAYSSYPEYRTDEQFSLALCNNCHRSFHVWHISKYGFSEIGKNTKEQYEEWYGEALDNLEKYNGVLPARKQVVCLEDDIIFNDTKECGDYYDISEYAVYACCSGKATSQHKHLMYLHDYEELSQSEIEEILNEKLTNYHNYHEIVLMNTGEVFDTMEIASEKTGVPIGRIRSLCNNIPLKKEIQLIDELPYIFMFKKKYEELSEDEVKQHYQDMICGHASIICLNNMKVFFNADDGGKYIGKDKSTTVWHSIVDNGTIKSDITGKDTIWKRYGDFVNMSLEEIRESLMSLLPSVYCIEDNQSYDLKKDVIEKYGVSLYVLNGCLSDESHKKNFNGYHFWNYIDYFKTLSYEEQNKILFKDLELSDDSSFLLFKNKELSQIVA